MKPKDSLLIKILLLLTLTIGAGQLLAQCDADAGPNVTTCSGTGIQIGGNPTAVNPGPGPGVTYSWTPTAGLNDPTVANPIASPTTTTTYTVTLSGNGCGGESDQVTVTVQNAPNANFSFSPNNQPCADSPISFTNTTTGCTSCQYTWDFGDGSATSSAANPSHTFNTAVGTGTQTFTVTLSAESANGCTDTQTATVTVKRIPDIELTDPISSFTQCNGDPTFPLTVFDASATTTGISSYTIDWGDGSSNWTGTTSPQGISHTYAGNDVFNLVYTVTGTNGCSTSETYYVSNITNPSIGAANPGGTQGCGPLTICFPLNNYDANHESTTYLVDFGDGSPTELLNHPPPNEICHTYSGSSCATNPSGYTFSITATNNCDQSVATIFPVKVYSAPVAGFTATPVPACVNSSVTFTNTSIAGYNNQCNQSGTYTWNFGDGSPAVTVASLASQSHVYTAAGTYTVTMTATNACGSSTVSQNVCIEVAPTPLFTVNDNDGCYPMAVTTDNTSLNPNSCNTSTTWIVNYSDLPCDPDDGTYSFTGGTNASSLEPQFQLTSVGIYTIRLQMSNSCGTFEDNEIVTVNTIPIVDVTTPTNVCVGTATAPSAFVDGCNLPVTAYQWTFTGASPASANTLTPPNITYSNQGSYTATLQATNSCGTGTDSGTMNVLPAPNVQITASDIDNVICYGQSTTLTATGAGTYVWSPSAYLSNYSSSGNTVQTNPTSAVTYLVTGYSGSCTDTTSITLHIDQLPVVNPSGTFEMCAGQNEQLGLTVTGGSGTYTSYLWSPNQNLNNNTIANPVSNSPTSINYTVNVTDDNGCTGTGTIPVTVNPLPPTFAGPDITLCNQPVATQLTGFSPTTGGTGPGGSGTWSGPNVTSTGSFTPAGLGPVTLTYCFTYASTGCSACDNMTITVQNPTPAVAGPDTTICSGATPIQLGPGSWSGSPNITAGGLYTPTAPMVDDVIVTQGNGSCATTDTLLVTVLALPVANAGLDTTICAGESVLLHSTCLSCPNGPPDFCTWSGGSTTPSLSCNPTTSPLFATTTFNVTLVDAAGCYDSDQVTIFVNPLPPTNAGPDQTVCNQPFVTQVNGSPAGGSWTGSGVTSTGAFTPSTTGIFPLTYCYTDQSTGCEACDVMNMSVINPTQADAGADTEICQNVPAFNMPTTTPGGNWTAVPFGSLTTAGLFTPSVADTFLVTLTVGVGTCLTTDDMTIIVNPLPSVDAGPDQNICVNESTQLNATISGGTPIYNTSWNFASFLNNSSIVNPIATPPNTTTFTVTVTDDNLCTDSDQITVFVNGLPVVEAGNNINVCDQPIEEVLTGFSPTTGGTGTWTGTGITDPSGIFMSPGVGSYWVYYEFTAGGNACSNTDSILVTVNAPVIANAGPDATICLNEGQYQLSGFAPAAGATWNGPGIIDPNNGILQSETAGVGTWTLEIEFGSGTCYTNDEMEITVLPLPVVSAGPGAVVCGNAAIFDLAGYTPSTGATWEGPGIIDATNATFDPSLGTGVYDVFIWYTSPVTGCSDSSYTEVNVSPVPVANFTVPVLGCTNSPADIQNLSSGATTYSWNFGNGDLLNGFEPVYTYPAPIEDIYDITLIAQNNFGCADTAVNANEIINPPVADLLIDPDMGCAPLSVSFDNQSVGQYMSYAWDLSIGASTDSIPSSLIYQQGPDVVYYPISLTVTNFCGSDSDTDEITVMPQPVANFGTNLDQDCSPFEVQFNNISTGLPDTYTWDFGDGTSSNLFEPVQHVFYADTIPVDYTIFLYLSNECGLDTASYTITVLPNTVTAFFNTNVTEGCEPLQVEFTDYSDGGTQISYNLGDGNLTGNDNPIHIYNDGNYTIYQYVDNGCSYDTAQISIVVYPAPDLDFEPNVPNMCTHNSVHFISEFENAVEFAWDFGDGGTSDLSSPEHEYTEGGNYIVSFTAVNDNGCTSTVTHPFVVFEGPQASFTVPNSLGCSPFELCFSNTALDGNFYSWDFGDGNTANTEDACNTYVNVSNTADLYNVSLIVQDLQLCSDTFTMEIIVAPQPLSAFTLSSYESCYYPQTVSATNLSQYANGYEWFVDNENVSDILNPSFSFSEEGVYQVELVASNQYNCTSVSEAEFEIHPLPVAAFSADPLEGCVPLDVSFFNESTGAEAYVWDFGDGIQSATEFASHTYEFNGAYDVALIAITDEGCRDTLEIDDMVRAYRLPVADFRADPEESDIYDPEIIFYDESQFASSYEWDFGDGGSSTMPDAVHTFPQAGTWNVTQTVYTNHGCSDAITKQVVINDIFNLYVPNTFTPDDDGINEVFLPQLTGIPFIERYKFEIFDRWGTIIFETNDTNDAWTGNVRGGNYYAKDDAYNWRITVQLKGSDKERVYQGHVILVR